MVSAQQGYESGKATVMQNSSILKITSKSPVICIIFNFLVCDTLWPVYLNLTHPLCHLLKSRLRLPATVISPVMKDSRSRLYHELVTRRSRSQTTSVSRVNKLATQLPAIKSLPSINQVGRLSLALIRLTSSSRMSSRVELLVR
jgi:hypothetical protein